MSKEENRTRIIAKLGVAFSVRDTNESSEYWDSIQYGNWEPETYRAFTALIHASDTFVDFGAFIGATVLFAQSLCARSYAVEADPLNFEALQENIALNPELESRIVATHAAVGPSTGVMQMRSPTPSISTKTSMLHSGAQGIKRRWNVDIYSVPDFFKKYGIETVNFIKIDIEGFEYALANDLARLIATQPDIVIFLALHPHIACQSGTTAISRILKAPFVFFIRFMKSLSIAIAVRNARNIYLSNGDKISPFHILRLKNLRGPFELVATTRTWE